MSTNNDRRGIQFIMEMADPPAIPDELRRVIYSLAKYKTGGNICARNALAKIGMAYLQQIITLAFLKAKEEEHFISATTIVKAIDNTGLHELAKKLEKHEEHCRQKDKGRILQELRNDPRVKVTSDLNFDFVESLFEQSVEFQGKASLEKPKPISTDVKRKGSKPGRQKSKKVKDDSSDWSEL